MTRLLYFILGGLLFFSSCRNQEIRQIISLPEAVELKSTSLSIDTELLIPTKILIKGEKLIIFEQLSKDMFKVFDYPSLNYLYSFGNRGRGPNEFISEIDILDSDGDIVEVYDAGRIKFIEFSDLSASIVSEIPISLSHLRNPINRLRKVNDSIYYFDNIFEGDQNNEFTRINIHSDERSYFSPYPNWVNEKNMKSEWQRYITYMKFSNYHTFYDKIVAFYYSFPVMKFLDFDGNDIKEIHIDVPRASFNEPSNDNTFYFLETSFLSDEFIYVLWAEKSKNEIMNHPENFRPEILIFDWSGNVAGRYKLDKPVTSFTISEKTGKIYCTPFPETEAGINVIFEYDLPKLDHNAVPLTRIQNSFYSSDILEGYRFSQTSVEDGINKIHEKNGLKINGNYFAQIRDKNGQGRYELETIYISVYTPIEEIDRDWLRDLMNIGVNAKNAKRRDINIDGLPVVQITYFFDSLSPQNEIGRLYVCSYFFRKDKSFVEMTICSKKNNFEQYHLSFKKMIRSFEYE